MRHPLIPLALLLSFSLLLASPPAAVGAPVANLSAWPAGRPPADFTGRLALDNGFEAFVVPRPGTPLVALLVAVRAGSRHETAATRGAAHLLEHLVFEGTAGRRRNEIFRWVYGIGGYLNGFTREDFTGYVLMGPPGELQAMARLLAELLSGARLSAEALDGVKAVVIEELRQAQVDPGYQDEVAFRRALYRGTPYAEPVLGSEETIRAITLDDLAAFYRRHYTPDNMIALAVGGAGAADMADALRTAFGPLPPARAPSPGGDPGRKAPGEPDTPPATAAPAEAAAPPETAAPPAVAAPRLPPAGAVVRAARQRTIRLVLLGPPPSEPAFGDFLALGDLLGSPASPLPAALAAAGAPAGLVPQAAAGTTGSLSTLEVHAEIPDGADPDAALAALASALTRLATTEGPAAMPGVITAEILARSNRHARLEAARLAERVHYFAMAQAPLLVAGRPDLALGGPAAARPEAVRAVLARSLAGGWVALLPAPPSAGTAAATGPAPEEAGAPPRREARLASGLRVVAETRSGSALVAAHLLAGGRLLAEPSGLTGATELLHRLLLKGPAGAAEPLEAQLAALGAAVSVTDDPREPFGDFYFARDFSGIRLEALPEAAEAALRLLAAALETPALDPASLDAARRETAALAAWRADTPRTLAEDRLWGRLFDGPLGAPPAGTPESLAHITPEALAAFHGHYFTPDNLVLSIVGGEPPERLVALAEAAFGSLRPGASHGGASGVAAGAALAPSAGVTATPPGGGGATAGAAASTGDGQAADRAPAAGRAPSAGSPGSDSHATDVEQAPPAGGAPSAGGRSRWPEPTPAAIAPDSPPLRLSLGAPQAQVRVGLVIQVRDARERAALSLAVGMLGASLQSRLRYEEGLAYSVGAELSVVGPYAVVTAGLGTRPSEVDRALGELTRLVAARAEAPVTSEEIARRAAAIAGRLASRQLSSATRAYYLGLALHEGAPHRYGDDYRALLASIRPAEVEAVQRRAFRQPLAAVIVE